MHADALVSCPTGLLSVSHITVLDPNGELVVDIIVGIAVRIVAGAGVGPKALPIVAKYADRTITVILASSLWSFFVLCRLFLTSLRTASFKRARRW